MCKPGTTVYCVEESEYVTGESPDTCVIAVFSTEAKAEEYVKSRYLEDFEENGGDFDNLAEYIRYVEYSGFWEDEGVDHWREFHIEPMVVR